MKRVNETRLSNVSYLTHIRELSISSIPRLHNYPILLACYITFAMSLMLNIEATCVNNIVL